MDVQLTTGSIDEILKKVEVNEPILQLIDKKTLGKDEKKNAKYTPYTLLMYDGAKFASFVRLSTQLENLITENKLEEYAVVKVLKYEMRPMKKHHHTAQTFMLISELEILLAGSEVKRMLCPKSQPNNEVSRLGSRLGSGSLPDATNAKARGKLTITPINELRHSDERWNIKARVIHKTEVKLHSDQKNENFLFSIILQDSSGEIKCVAANDACNRCHNFFEVGKIYSIFKCRLVHFKRSNRYMNKKSEIKIDFITNAETCTEEDESIPKTIKFDFQPIASIKEKGQGHFVDVLGMVKSFKELSWKLVIINLVDDSKATIDLKLGGCQAANFDGGNAKVIAVRAKIGTYQGTKFIGAHDVTMMEINPNIPESDKLQEWYRTNAESIIDTGLSISELPDKPEEIADELELELEDEPQL